MDKRIKTEAAQLIMQQALAAEIEQAAGGNGLLAKKETPRLEPFLQRAALAARAEKPKGATLKSGEVAAKAIEQARAVWDQFNPPGHGSDSTYFSKRELEQSRGADPELYPYSQSAYVTAGGLADPDGDRSAVRNFIERLRNVGAILKGNVRFGREINARPGQPGRAEVPPAVLEAYDAYAVAQNGDWGTVTLKSLRVAGRAFYTVHLGTDGDPAYLEAFTPAGRPVASARFVGDSFARWDDFFGLGRFAGGLGRAGHPVVDGYSEDDERAAAGQILSTWVPEASITRGALEHDHDAVTALRTDLPLSGEQQEVARAAFELLFQRTYAIRLGGSLEPLELGPQAAGQLRIGRFQNPVDGQDYLVADWRDNDDASFTFYFQRQDSGVLRLAIEQTNG